MYHFVSTNTYTATLIKVFNLRAEKKTVLDNFVRQLLCTVYCSGVGVSVDTRLSTYVHVFRTANSLYFAVWQLNPSSVGIS